MNVRDEELHRSGDNETLTLLKAVLCIFYPFPVWVPKGAFPSRTPIHFLQESCRSGRYQTLSARILQES